MATRINIITCFGRIDFEVTSNAIHCSNFCNECGLLSIEPATFLISVTTPGFILLNTFKAETVRILNSDLIFAGHNTMGDITTAAQFSILGFCQKNYPATFTFQYAPDVALINTQTTFPCVISNFTINYERCSQTDKTGNLQLYDNKND